MKPPACGSCFHLSFEHFFFMPSFLWSTWKIVFDLLKTWASASHLSLFFGYLPAKHSKGRTIRKLMGRGGEVQKKKFAQRKIKWKNSCQPFNPKKYSCYGLKKVHTRDLITKKNSCGSKIPLPPHNFSNGPSLIQSIWHTLRHLSHVHFVYKSLENAL